MENKQEKMSAKKLTINITVFVVLILLTFKFVLKDLDLNQIINLASSVNPIYIAIAIIFMMVFVMCEAINIRRVLVLLEGNIEMIKCIKYACVGFFYSAITPFASGGDPLQIYYMSRDNVNISSSTLAIFLDLASYQIVTITIAVISFVANIKFVQSINASLFWFLIAGVVFNGIILMFLLIFMFSTKISNGLSRFVSKLADKSKSEKLRKFDDWLKKEIKKYQESSKFIKKNKMVLIKNIMTTSVQILCFYSIPIIMFLSFGVKLELCLKMFSLQAILTVAVSIFPLPGAVGANELGFIAIYSALVSKSVVNSTMLLSRGVSFYLFVIVTGVFIFTANNFYKAVKKGKKSCQM